MWTFQIIFLVFALGCFTCAITGGDVTIKGIGIPKLSNLQRWFATVAGAAFLGLAVVFYYLSQGDEPPPPPEPVVITDRLGSRQTYQRLSVEIDGAHAGDIVLTSTTRTGHLSVPATNRMANYLLGGEEVSRSPNGESIQRRLVGEGAIPLLAGGQFCVKTSRRLAKDAADVSRRMLVPIDQCLP